MNLENGSKYSGRQLSSTGSFNLVMKIDNLNLDENIMCGTLNIYKSNSKIIQISTYFEARVIGSEMATKLKDLESDGVNWEKFPEFSKGGDECLYFRIKELFILPNMNLEQGEASIDGFYYCCYYKNLDCFMGRYFYKCGEKNMSQQILLERQDEGISGSACII
ncbi:glucose-induced degradation protein 4-like protein [Vairimorpha necatrix]|uniref:Glucose-induced degradation protein 4-like protein n=1 Tax=Vairimorpha necatrix TaxID=6039 RepID=A0AAX4JGI3_9MICR